MKVYVTIIIFILISNLTKAQYIFNNYEGAYAETVRVSKMPDDSTKVKGYFSVINLYPETFKERLYIAQRALKCAERIKWENGIGLSYYYMAWHYFYTNQRDAALMNFRKVTEHSTDPIILVNSFGCISNSYSWDGKYEEAYEAAMKGLAVAEKSNNNKIIAEALIFLGDAFRYHDDMETAKLHYFRALEVMENNGKTEMSMSKMSVYVYLIDSAVDDPFSILSAAFHLKNSYDRAEPFEKQIQALTLVKIALAYILSSEKENIKKVQLEAEEKQRKIYIAGIVFLTLLIVLLIWQNHSRKKAIEELAKANEMKSRFFGILNHDLRRPVAGLISFLQLKTHAPEVIAPEDAATFEQKTISTAQNLLGNMEDLLFWCKDQMQSFTPEIRQVSVSKLFDDTRDFFNYEDKVSIIFENPLDLKIKTDENYVKTIMRNLTSNAITVTSKMEAPLIKWVAFEEKGKLVLSITNNGEPMPEEKINILRNKGTERNIKDGLGLNIIRDLSASIHCKIEVMSGNTNTTTFRLIF